MKLDPLCLKDEIGLAVSNRGHLIPCCRCDEPHTMNDTNFQKLLAVSKISDVDDLNEILLSEEWIEFYNNLKNNKGPKACFSTCRVDKPENHRLRITMTRPKTNELLYKNER